MLEQLFHSSQDLLVVDRFDHLLHPNAISNLIMQHCIYLILSLKNS